MGDAEAMALDDARATTPSRSPVARGTTARSLDGYIGDAARNWRVERLATIDRLLLRLAVHELLAFPAHRRGW